MRALVIGAVLVGGFASLARLAVPTLSGPAATEPGASANAAKERRLSVRMPCPPHAIPEGDVCVPLPTAPVEADGASGSPLDLIPRLPDRPADLAPLELPIATPTSARFDVEPDLVAERRARFLRLGTARGEPARSVSLVGQLGDADVLFVGDFVGRTVVTLHRTTEGGKARDYLVFLMGLDGFGPDVAPGKGVRPGDVLGFAGDALSPGEPTLLCEVRQVRDDVDPRPLDVEKMADPATSIAVDPRNVFPARAANPAP